jgi:hypothetical protein
MQERPYHHPLARGRALRTAWSYSLARWSLRLHQLFCWCLVQDWPFWLFPEFTRLIRHRLRDEGAKVLDPVQRNLDPEKSSRRDRYSRHRPGGLLHIPMQRRLYHHPRGVSGASGRLALRAFALVVAPSPTICWCLAQDCPVWTSPEFTRFSMLIAQQRN